MGGSNSGIFVGHGVLRAPKARRSFSPGKFWKVKAEWWHLEVFVAIFSCQNQVTKCTLCHEKHLRIYIYIYMYIYMLNDFHADSFSNMLWHYASHHTVFNPNSIRKLIYFITIFKWCNTRNVKCKIFKQTDCRKNTIFDCVWYGKRDWKLPQPVKVSSPLCHIIHNQRLCIFQYVPLICYNIKHELYHWAGCITNVLL